MSPRILTPIALLALVAFGAPAHAASLEGEIKTKYVRVPDPKDSTRTVGKTLVFLETRSGSYRVDDPEMADSLYRFRNHHVALEGTLGSDDEGTEVLTVREIVEPVRWDGVRGTVSKSSDGKHWSPRFTPEGKTKALRVFGRSYFALKKVAGKQAVIRGWYFAREGEVCVTDIRGQVLDDTILTRVLVRITGHVKRGETVWVRGLSLFRFQVLVENAKGDVGHVLPEQVRIGEPSQASTSTGAGRRGLTQGVEDGPE